MIRTSRWLGVAACVCVGLAVGAAVWLARPPVEEESTPEMGPNAGGLWHTVFCAASAGTVDEADLDDVAFVGPRAKIINSATNSTSVIRYNITPYYENAEADLASLYLYVSYKDNGPESRIVARLKSINAFSSAATTLLVFDSDDFAQSDEIQNNSVSDPSGNTNLDYASIWFVEVTITRGAAAGRPELESLSLWARTS
jgi:hypothetical protein